MQFVIVACALLGVALGQYTGYTGYPGYAGYAGYAGYPGYAGYTGYAGYPGVAGYRGYTGYQGYQGYPGYYGYQGYQGYNGYPGYYANRFQPLVPAAVKPDTAKPGAAKSDVAKSDKTVVPALPTLPVIAPIAPIAPIVPLPKAVYGGPNIAIRSQTQDNYPDGSYSYSYQTENGISVGESGSPSVGPNGPEEVVHGEYSYVAPNGQLIQVRYTADANGYHPEGAHLPGNSGYVTGVEGRALPVVVAPVAAVKAANPIVKSE